MNCFIKTKISEFRSKLMVYQEYKYGPEIDGDQGDFPIKATFKLRPERLVDVPG